MHSHSEDSLSLRKLEIGEKWWAWWRMKYGSGAWLVLVCKESVFGVSHMIMVVTIIGWQGSGVAGVCAVGDSFWYIDTTISEDKYVC
jgi:hypothetical protein